MFRIGSVDCTEWK